MDTKLCPKCSKTKPVADFFKNRSSHDGLHTYCKPCFSVYTKDYAKRNPDLYRAASRRCYYRKLAERYGMTATEFEAIYEKFKGLCAICQQPEKANRTGRTRRICVDHCHVTGKFRGLLCAACNQALGLFHDDPRLLHRAIAYLRQFK